MATYHDLYERLGREVVRFASSLVGANEAQDIVHDAMTSLMASHALAGAESIPTRQAGPARIQSHDFVVSCKRLVERSE